MKVIFIIKLFIFFLISLNHHQIKLLKRFNFESKKVRKREREKIIGKYINYILVSIFNLYCTFIKFVFYFIIVDKRGEEGKRIWWIGSVHLC